MERNFEMMSFWEREAFFGDIDIAVIGAGIVGLNAAISLKKQNPALKVAVLERGLQNLGASSKNAGFACFGSPGELLDDLEHSSEDTVFSLVEKRWKGLHKLRANLGDTAIDYHNWGGYEVFENKEEYLACREKLPYLNKHLHAITGEKEIYTDASDKISEFGLNGVAGMLLNNGEGQLNTGKMLMALMRKAWSVGIYILHGADVKNIAGSMETAEITLGNGVSFACSRALICTNGFAGQLSQTLDVTPARAQVLITKPIPGLKLKGTFHFDKGYYYFRNIDGRILFGGGRNLDPEGEKTAEQGLTPLIQNRLDDLLHTMIAPYAKAEIDMRWSGIMGLGHEKTTIMKQIDRNVYCAVRMGGMGVAIGSLIGEEAAAMVLQTI